MEEAIGSVLDQRGVTVEIIVIDDSPEGSALRVVEAIQDARVTLLRNTSPTGGVPSAVRNMGWPRAKGSFVHFLDDDDIVPDGHYIAVKDAFSAHPRVGMIFGRVEPFGKCPAAQLEHEKRYFANAARMARRCQRFGPKMAFAGKMLFGDALLVCSAAVVRREIIARVGGYDPGIRLMEDADFHLRAIRECGAHFIDRVAVKYRIGSPSLMHSPNPDELQLEMQRIGHRKMQTKYRRERGAIEFYALALFSRALLRR